MRNWHWGLLKAVVIVLSIYGGLAPDKVRSGPSVPMAILISAICFLLFSGYLFVRRRDAEAEVDWSISIAGPFWPMRQFPLQFLALASVAAIVIGGTGLLRAVMLEPGDIGDRLLCLLSGVAIGLAVLLNPILMSVSKRD